MSLLFALVLIGLPAIALLYDFRSGGQSTTMFVPQSASQTGIDSKAE